MQTFMYMGALVYYERKDGKIIVSLIDYNGEKHECEHTFNKISELKRFVELGGWKV